MAEAALKAADEDTGAEAIVETPVEEAEEVEAQEAEAESGDADERAEAERLAKTLGWRPKEKFKGDPDLWRDADEFLDRYEKDNLHLRKTVKIISEDSAKTKRELAETKKELEDFRKKFDGYTARTTEDKLAEIETKMEEAAATGDTEAFKRWRAEEKKLRNGHAEVDEKVVAKPDEPTEIADWKTKRVWFDRDRAATAEAVGFYQGYTARNPGCAIEEALEYTDKRMARDYPELYGENPRRREAPKVESTGSVKIGKKGAKGWADIPPEDKQVAKAARLIGENGPFKTQEEYSKVYWQGVEQRTAR
jgi:hypothetical protein